MTNTPNILSDRQKKLLECFSREPFIKKHFYLTGGTALAGFYLFHRYSEDLDFFSEKEFDVSALTVFFQKHRKNLGIVKIDFQQSYNRNLFLLQFTNEIVKIEFTFFPFPRIETGAKAFDFPLDSVFDIAVNKLFTIYQQSRARDYIDLYCIIEKYKWNIDELVVKARLKFDWHIDYLQLGTQFVKAKKVTDFPRMIIDLPEKKWRNFFLKEAKKLKSEVAE